MVIGLANNSNYCYMNSVLQVLASIQEFDVAPMLATVNPKYRNFMVELDKIMTKIRNHEQVREYRSVCGNHKSFKFPTIRAMEFKNQFDNLTKNSKMDNGIQQDAHEFLTFIIQNVLKAMLVTDKMYSQERDYTADDIGNLTKIVKHEFKRFKSFYKPECHRFLKEFVGLNFSIVKCHNCNACSIRFTDSVFVTLNLGDARPEDYISPDSIRKLGLNRCSDSNQEDSDSFVQLDSAQACSSPNEDETYYSANVDVSSPKHVPLVDLEANEPLNIPSEFCSCEVMNSNTSVKGQTEEILKFMEGLPENDSIMLASNNEINLSSQKKENRECTNLSDANHKLKCNRVQNTDDELVEKTKKWSLLSEAKNDLMQLRKTTTQQARSFLCGRRVTLDSDKIISLSSFIKHQLNRAQQDVDDYRCDSCKQRVKATHYSILGRIPPCMFVYYQRTVGFDNYTFEPIISRATVALDKNFTFKLPRNCTVGKKNLKYELISLIDYHPLGRSSGHYLSCVFDDAFFGWFLCNDSSIMRVSEPMISESNYLMAFRLKL